MLTLWSGGGLGGPYKTSSSWRLLRIERAAESDRERRKERESGFLVGGGEGSLVFRCESRSKGRDSSRRIERCVERDRERCFGRFFVGEGDGSLLRLYFPRSRSEWRGRDIALRGTERCRERERDRDRDSDFERRDLRGRASSGKRFDPLYFGLRDKRLRAGGDRETEPYDERRRAPFLANALEGRPGDGERSYS